MRPILGAVFALLASGGVAAAQPFTFVAIGDLPYKLPDDYARFERLIGDINRVAPAFTVHVGDIKSGGSPCTDANFQKIKDDFATFAQPLIYTPGDNEWTDCHRERAGGFEPLERLDKVRAMFFERPESFGRVKLPLERQSEAMPSFKTYVENQRWTHDGVMFATVHVVGSNNGFERNQASVAEYFARDAANLAWIEDTFAKATAANAPAVVLAFQANPYWQTKPALRGGDDGFRNTLAALAAGAEAFKKPVLLIQGDDHVLIIDQPLLDSKGEDPLPNVTRLQVMGDTLVHGVKVLVDPADPGVFGFVPLIVKENLEFAGPG